MKKAGYLGPPGTFSHDAAHEYTKDYYYHLIEYDSIQKLIHGVENGEVHKGIVPIENALEGTVNLTIDMLIHEVDLNIVGELNIPIRHCLMARKGVAIEDITRILSHPQALAQCRKFLDSTLLSEKREATESTASAVVRVKAVEKSWGAVASPRAAQIYGLNILKEDIQDNDTNSTRFIVISKDKGKVSGMDKTTIVFTVNHEPGSLYDALKIFADKDINLTKIESRPMRTLLGHYLFWVDLEGHRDEGIIRDALDQLLKKCKFFKILGSYPRFITKTGRRNGQDSE
ncbi:MAG TPA: prephenate dehydratase [Clostridia bacterium]|nr:prephenate dehydratase [Clostridia bacterium]